MTISFRVEDYLPAGVEKQIFEPLFLPISRIEEAVPASLIEMTVGDVTREVWIQRSENSEGPSFKPVPFGDRLFEIAYDVSRRPLDFELKLDKFEGGFEPGTEQPTKFVSQVRLTDPSRGIKAEPHTISMNEPLSHRGLHLLPDALLGDRRTRTRASRPGSSSRSSRSGPTPAARSSMPAACLLVLGIFTQFYMRAGVFTDGGKKERERSARKAATSPDRGPERARPGQRRRRTALRSDPGPVARAPAPALRSSCQRAQTESPASPRHHPASPGDTI